MAHPAQEPEWNDETLDWLARESVRNAELVLAGHGASLTAMEARVTQVMTWSIGALMALAAGSGQPAVRMMLACAGPFLACASWLCIIGLWPSGWHYPGFAPAHLRADLRATVRQNLEANAGAYDAMIGSNLHRLRRFSFALRAAWCVFVAAGLAAVVGVMVAGA